MKFFTKVRIEIIIIAILCIAVYWLSWKIDLFEFIHEVIISHEHWELDEFIPVIIALNFFLLVFSIRRLIEKKKSGKILEKKNEELMKALGEIKTLSGLLPVCSRCRKIKNSDGYWKSLEAYIMDHTDALITHGICEDCAKELYGDEEWFDESDLNKTE